MFKLTVLSIIVYLLLFSSAIYAVIENNGTDYADLMAFKSRLVLETDDILSTNWTSNTDYCTWFGVSCFNQRVTSLVLTGMALRGELSLQISNLTHLEELNLSSNNLGGFLPKELGSLQQLMFLDLSNNSFMGAIPTNLSTCRKLQELRLGRNFIAGTIPQELASLRNLLELRVEVNSLTGNISFGNFYKF